MYPGTTSALVLLMLGAAAGAQAPVKALTADAQAAVTAARSEFLKHFSKCGENHVSRIDLEHDEDELVELKDVSFRFDRVLPRTAADKANGLQWQGIVAFRFTTARYYFEEAWGPWEEPREIWLGAEDAIVTRVQGEWRVRLEFSHGSGQRSSYLPLACRDIPPG
jgi:hypothetical protein